MHIWQHESPASERLKRRMFFGVETHSDEVEDGAFLAYVEEVDD